MSANPTLPGFPHVDRQAKVAATVSRHLLQMDDPEHRKYRQLLAPEFLVRAVNNRRPEMQRIVDELVDNLLFSPRPVDLVEGFATLVPSMVMCHLLGIPYTNRNYFRRLVRLLRQQSTSSQQAAAAVTELDRYMLELLIEKQKIPCDDLLSRLAVDYLDTGKFSLEELAPQARILLVAGHEMTARMIVLSTLVLLEHPLVYAEISQTESPELIVAATEELLRYLSILQVGIRRVAVRDLYIGGHAIRAGEGIIIPIDIANRDPDAFVQPGNFDIRRNARHHLAFGFGVHQCVGQTLVRAQMQIVLKTLFRRIPNMRLVSPFANLKYTNESSYGVEELLVTWPSE
ncbi:cytochrome P450 [Mycobacterium haemophilum]